MFTLLIFLFVIAVLVVSHEFGHFLAAKWRGMQVDEFGFGFPPRLFGKKIGETIYSFNAIPFGGFVRILGEDDSTGIDGNPRSFASRKPWERFLVLVAGVGMNFVSAYLLFTTIHAMGIPTALEEKDISLATNVNVEIVGVAPNSPAESVGFHVGDALKRLEVPGHAVDVFKIPDVQTFIERHAGESVTITLQRNENTITYQAVPRRNPPPEEGSLGIQMAHIGIIASSWYKAPWDGLTTTLFITKEVTFGLGMFFFKLFRVVFMEDVAGPVGIAQIAGQAHAMGIVYLLQLVALLSINLAVLNLLPIPALDGGRVFFLCIEKIRGGIPVNAHISQYAHSIGFVVLILCMLFVTYRDIVRWIGW